MKENSEETVFSPSITWNRCVPSCREEDMNPSFMKKVYVLASFVNGLDITSAFRTPAWEYSRNRSGDSQHCKGLAVDVACRDSQYKRSIVEYAILLDFHRILIYPTFIHLDDKDQGKRRDLIWMKG